MKKYMKNDDLSQHKQFCVQQLFLKKKGTQSLQCMVIAVHYSSYLFLRNWWNAIHHSLMFNHHSFSFLMKRSVIAQLLLNGKNLFQWYHSLLNPSLSRSYWVTSFVCKNYNWCSVKRKKRKREKLEIINKNIRRNAICTLF